MEDVSSLANAASEIMGKGIQNEMKNNNNEKKEKCYLGILLLKGNVDALEKKRFTGSK